MKKLRTLKKLGFSDAEIDQYAVDFSVSRARAIESLQLKPKGSQGSMF